MEFEEPSDPDTVASMNRSERKKKPRQASYNLPGVKPRTHKGGEAECVEGDHAASKSIFPGPRN